MRVHSSDTAAVGEMKIEISEQKFEKCAKNEKVRETSKVYFYISRIREKL